MKRKTIGMAVAIFASFFGRLSFCSTAAEPSATGESPAMTVVTYEAFGARGDGQTDDLPAIVEAHAFANERGLPVRARDGATYYIGGRKLTAIVQTDTDFGAARFVIDDTQLETHRSWVFEVRPSLPPMRLEGLASLKRGQAKLAVPPGQAALVIVADGGTKRFIRRGANQNQGNPQTDVFLVDADGAVDPSTPILWDFQRITSIQALPLNEAPLTIRGGHFTTIANAAESNAAYHYRGIAIRRSGVNVVGLEHHVRGEGEQGAPYMGFLNIADCAKVTVRDTVFTGRKTYRTTNAAGKAVSTGSYDLHVSRAVNVSFVNCRQTNDIMDRRYWGIMASNFSKNLLYDGCTLSRFDAHQGVHNATIRNSTLGHMGINLIGGGTFLAENTTVRGMTFINLRADYGSTWQGDIIIRNCVFAPSGPKDRISVIGGSNDGQHDFGYPCSMPHRVVIEGLRIEDAPHPASYRGPTLFADFNPRLTDDSFQQPFPYAPTREVVLKNVVTASGLPLRLSDNAFLFRNTIVK